MLLVTTFACGGGSGQGSAPAGWSTYTTSSLGFSIQYPQDWMKFEEKTGVTFITPKTGASVPPGTVFVSLYEEEQSVTLNDAVSIWATGMEETFQGFNLSESSAVTLADIPAHKFVYTWEDDNGSLMKNMEIITIKNSKDFVITYMVNASAYSNYLETAQQMIDSFRFD